MTGTTYTPPAPGCWELDDTHFTRPITRYIYDAYFLKSFQNGFKEGTEKYGLPVTHLAPARVNGFLFMKTMPFGAPEDAAGPPPEEVLKDLFNNNPDFQARFDAGAKAMESAAWREDLKRWDEEVKPDSIKRNLELQAVDLASLDDAGLIGHLEACFANVELMFFRHHQFSIPALLPLGLFLANTVQWTGLPPGKILESLKNSSPVSGGIAQDEMRALIKALESAGLTAGDATDAAEGNAELDRLSAASEAVKGALETFRSALGMRLVTGYDICGRTIHEMPQMIVGMLRGAMDDPSKRRDGSSADAAIKSLRAAVPEDARARFDQLLAGARELNRLRDERGVYNDLHAAGISRHAILEAGRRLAERNLIADASHLVEATHEETIGLLRDGTGVSSEELAKRYEWGTTKTTDDAPGFLGVEPSPPPPLDWLPERARPGAMAFGMSLGQVFAASDEANEGKQLKGLSVNSGVYEGTARVVTRAEDLGRIQVGDILVARNTSASINFVLPLLGAIVTDRGGQLSHAAIVSREYGIPGVVGTRDATSVIKDGDRIRVDGGAGSVQVL